MIALHPLRPAWLWVIGAVLMLLAASAAAQMIDTKLFPPLSGRVVDEANLLSPQDEAQITQRLATLEAQTGRQLVVATIPSLEGRAIEDYGYQLGRHWGIGEKGKNTGMILLVAPNDRKMRIEVGYGLEPYVTDGLAGSIIRNEITPRFKAGDYAGGIAAGVDRLAAQLALPPEEAAKRARGAQQAETRRADSGFSAGSIMFWLFIFLFFFIPALRSFARMGRRYDGPWGKRSSRARRAASGVADVIADIAPIIIWSALNDRDRGSGGRGGFAGGGGWGGGGGFSGGGGSFGGGGASGSW